MIRQGEGGWVSAFSPIIDRRVAAFPGMANSCLLGQNTSSLLHGPGPRFCHFLRHWLRPKHRESLVAGAVLVIGEVPSPAFNGEEGHGDDKGPSCTTLSVCQRTPVAHAGSSAWMNQRRIVVCRQGGSWSKPRCVCIALTGLLFIVWWCAVVVRGMSRTARARTAQIKAAGRSSTSIPRHEPTEGRVFALLPQLKKVPLHPKKAK